MKIQRLPLLVALSFPALVAFDAVAQKLAYGPEDGTSVTINYSRANEVSLEEMEMTMGGQDLSAMMGDMEMNMSTTVEVTVTDEYVSMGKGRPAKLKRTFDSLLTSTDVSTEMAAMPEPMEVAMKGSSELEGETVVFTWNDEEGEYEVAYPGEGDEELLEDLEEELDFRALLPDADVSKDETWEVDPNALRPAFAPSGSLKMTPAADEGGDSPFSGMGGSQPSMDQVLDGLEGEVVATFGGTRDEEGVQVAVIKLEIEVESANDLSDYAEDMMSEMEIPGMEIEMDLEAFDVEYGFEGEGTLLWNLETNLPLSLEITGESNMITDQTIHMSLPGQGDQTMEQSMTMGGTETIKISFE